MRLRSTGILPYTVSTYPSTPDEIAQHWDFTEDGKIIFRKCQKVYGEKRLHYRLYLLEFFVVIVISTENILELSGYATKCS